MATNHYLMVILDWLFESHEYWNVPLLSATNAPDCLGAIFLAGCEILVESCLLLAGNTLLYRVFPHIDIKSFMCT